MAVTKKMLRGFSGLSTDSKADVQTDGFRFTETDTGREFSYRSGAWHEHGNAAVFRTTEQTFGTSPVAYGQWTITDPDVLSTSHILVSLTVEVPSALRDGVSADGDEAEMEPMDMWAESIVAGSFLLVACPRDGPVDGPYKFSYTIGA